MALTDALQLDRAVLAVRGADAEDFLQNLLTQDMGALRAAPAIYAGLLTPQGKVAFDFLIWRDGEDFLFDVAAGRAEALAQRLALYRLRAKVQIEPVAASVWAAPAGPHADPRLAALGARDIRRGGPAAPHDEPEPYRAHRLALGVPDLVRDGGENEAFALEALFEELNGVDFKKGCFIGQENVSRMKRRATTRRKFCPVAFEGPAPSFGAPIAAGAAEIGAVRGGMPGRALAFLRLDRAEEARRAGRALEAEGKALRIDPPAWLLLPAGE